MDAHLKERLIGAVVLVVLGVWLIPWVLDGPDREPETAAEPLELPTDQESAAVKTQVIDLSARNDASERYAARPAGAADSDARGASPATRDVAGSTEAPPTAAAVQAPQNAESRSVPAATTATTGTASVATAAPAAAAPAAGDFMVQLGSFSEEANARRLVDRVATYGYEAQVSTYRSGGRDMHRVRVGPHATRNAAEAAASSLSAHGFPASVVTVD
jgi:DedD protein